MAEFSGIRTRSGAIVQPTTGDEMIRKFQFTAATAGLNNGVTVYTPTIGDILLNCWVEIDTAFDGINPRVDVGQFINAGAQGWFAFSGTGPIDASAADRLSMDDTGLLSSNLNLSYAADGSSPVSPIADVGLDLALNLFVEHAAGAFNHIDFQRYVPAKFTTANPVKLVCSQDGKKGGTATGATVGSGAVYFVTGTPQ